MKTQLQQPWAVLALSLGLLAGCTNNEPKPTTPDPSATAQANAEFNKPAEPAIAPKPAAEVKNPTAISFEKMSVSLDNKGREIVAQVIARAKSSRKIAVIGFCDRSQVANPAEAAVARAVAVRDELIRLGVPPATIQVKFVTKVAKKHVAEIQFDPS